MSFLFLSLNRHQQKYIQIFTKGRGTSRPKAVNRPTNRPIPARGSATVPVDKGPSVALPTLIRPPLAGPYAFSRIPTPVDDNPKIYLIRDPPPTWIFSSAETGYTHLHTPTHMIPFFMNYDAIFSQSFNRLA